MLCRLFSNNCQQHSGLSVNSMLYSDNTIFPEFYVSYSVTHVGMLTFLFFFWKNDRFVIKITTKNQKKNDCLFLENDHFQNDCF